LTSENSDLTLGRTEKLTILLIYAVLTGATIGGAIAYGVIGRASAVLAGLGLAAFVFGLRHGMDADHIAAIDNVTRKMIQEGRRPLTVGAWFSLGHSTVVLLLIVTLVAATQSVVEAIPFLQGTGAILGTAVSWAFLWLIGLINLAIVFSLYRVFHGMKRSESGDEDYQKLLEARGFLNHYFGPLFRIVDEPWKAYFMGLLFGIGFDTASEIALIAISVGVGVSGSAPIWEVLLLPFMFTCGMVLVDTTDGVAMRLAYGWAGLNPLRKIYYNLTVTVISVLVAFAIGTVELLQVLGLELNLHGMFWASVGSVDFGTLGLVVVGVFAGTWLVSMANWKYKNYGEPGASLNSLADQSA
jgi:high-affinity nickel-transport protein